MNATLGQYYRTGRGTEKTSSTDPASLLRKLYLSAQGRAERPSDETLTAVFGSPDVAREKLSSTEDFQKAWDRGEELGVQLAWACIEETAVKTCMR